MRQIFLLILFLSLFGCVQRLGDEPEIFQITRSNDAKQLASLLAAGADPNIKNGVGVPLLHVASGAKGGLAVVTILLNAGANPNATNDKGRTALHDAAAWCNIDIVSALLAGGADPYLLANDGRSALDATCSQPVDRRQQVIQILRAAM